MIGLSLAALVAGSLVTLAVLAQRVSLDVPLANPVVARPPASAGSPPPLVVDNAFPVDSEEPPEGRELDVPVDRVLPLRIARPAEPAQPSKGDGPKKDNRPEPRGPDHPGPGPDEPASALPPGIVKKLNRGRELPPGHSTRAAASAKRFPHERSNGRGRGACGAPPCGAAHGHSSAGRPAGRKDKD